MVWNLVVRIFEVNAVGIESGTQRTAGVTGGRRDEHSLETRFSEDPCIGDTVQCYATAHAKIARPHFLAKRTGDVQQCVFEDALHAGGTVRKPLPLCALQINRLEWVSWRAE